MKKILTFTDGSRYAPSVYDHSAWAAGRLQASLQLIHTLNPHRETAARADLSGSLGFDARDSLLDEMVAFDRQRAQLSQKKGEAILADATERLNAAGIEYVATEQRHGLFVDVLEDLHEEAELIVIGKRGKNASIEMKHLGTNIERTLRVAHRPVLVASRDFKPINSFALAYDGGPASQKALEYALNSPLLKGLKANVITVGNAKDHAQAQKAGESLKNAGFEVNVALKEGSPAKAIAEEVENSSSDLLVMGAYGHSKYKRLLIGSTTAALVRDCHVPVLMFR
ncbi:universal stress protein [Pelagicoccus sp. SDUM812002]|uniref:universal stress protein n=1 Tax=Pelagicoccus sp. SDUM812002 TaxID=3041266 RepID=UPI00280C549B|nr:universal stress protein [Pelagicoccus sp. SDUM812002]MDQ8184951.1 universal stress protein [Pelagicoccus sp. SDUM812002]